MLVYKTGIDVSTLQLKSIAVEMDVTFRSAVDTVASLPASNNVNGDARMALDNDHLFVYLDSEWLDQGVFDIGDILQNRLMQELS